MNLENLKIAVIRDGPPGCPGGTISSELFAQLKTSMSVEEIMCGRERDCKRINWERLPNRVITYRTKHFRDRQLLCKIPRYDIYHFQSPVFASLVRHRRPAIVTVYDLIPLRYPACYSDSRRQLVKRRLTAPNEADHIIAISQSTKRDLIQLLGIDPGKIDVILLGINRKIYKPRAKAWARKKLNLPPDKTILLNIGTENENKNIDRLVRIFYKLQKEYKDLLLVRVGLKERSVDYWIDNLGLRDKILRVGFLEDSPHLYYNAADMYICGDLSGGFGMPNLEAMASGCPVVTSETGAFPEVVSDAGLFFDPYNEDDIFKKISRLLKNTDLRKEYIQRGLERAKYFSWRKMAQATIKLYAQLARQYYGTGATLSPRGRNRE
jgi:glycosyltransferase involved in cell wall biosynthesis